MLASLKQKYQTNTKANAITFLVVFSLILVGYIVGINWIGLGVSQSVNLTIFSAVTIVLFFWSYTLYTKAQNYEKTIANQSLKIQQEIEKRQDALQKLHFTNKQLSSTSGYLERIIQESTDLITAVDTDFRYISFNNSFKESMKDYFGVELKEGIKLDELLVNYPKEVEMAKELWKRSFSGEYFTEEQLFTDVFGKLNIFELSYAPIKNKSGEIIGASQIARNITKKKLAAEKLKRERDFASAVFDVNKSLILVLNRDGMIVKFNKACELVSGYTEDEVKGRFIWNLLIPAEDISNLRNQLRNFDFEGFNVEQINKWITKDEKIKYISWQISAIKDEHGINEFIVATGIDITERRDIEISQKRLLEILENSIDNISISSPRGNLIYLNSAGRKMLNLSKETDISKLKTTNYHPDWVNELLKSEAYPTADREGTWIGETALKVSEEEDIPISHLIMAHKNENNEVEYYSSVIRDSSYRTKIVEELARAKEDAIAENRRSSDFLANMSHEIRTPMTGVIGLTDLLLNTDLTVEQRDYLEAIQKSGDTLLTIINDILDYSKLEAGKLTFENVDFDLYKTIESAFELFAKIINQKNLELILHIDNDVPNILIGDAGRLQQVLVNFISNAVKFTSKGEIVINVSVESDEDSPILHFSIKDTGIGVSASALRNLFKPYIQADRTISKRFGGTGLGLTISKQLITLMNGEIGATSEEGVGSTFWFTAKFQKPDTEKHFAFENQNLKNVRTLIVVENISQGNVLQSLTKSWGMLPDVANTGKNALEILHTASKKGEDFELIIIDTDLQGFKDISLVQEINQNKSLRKANKVLILPQTENNIVKDAEQIEIKHFITKPISLIKLHKELVSIFPDERKNTHLNTDINDTILKSPPETISTNHVVNLIDSSNFEGASTMNLEINSTKHILIAEDNLVNQKVIMTQVSGLGYQVDLVENGKEAIDALQSKDYSLILMDCQMPVMDGYTATKEIRLNQNLNSKHIPIIAVTAHAIEGDREKCLSAGMDDYISKPTKQQTLGKAISFWLHKSTQDIISSKKSALPIMPQETDPANSESKNIHARLIELEESCGVETVLDCIGLFLEDSQKLINEISLSINHQKFKKIAIDAHKLKGSSANMGASKMPKYSQELINLAKEENLSSITLIFNQILKEYEFIKTVYQKKKESYEQLVQFS